MSSHAGENAPDSGVRMTSLLRPDRRTVLTSLSFSAMALSTRQSLAQVVDQWFPIKSDDGKPVANLRLPVELTSEVDELQGLIRIGAKQPDVTVVEFYDYNCPFCRKAAPELENAIRIDKGLQLGLVNNPILSAGSKEAARHELAILKLAGSETARRFHLKLFEAAGRIDGAAPRRSRSRASWASTRKRSRKRSRLRMSARRWSIICASRHRWAW